MLVNCLAVGCGGFIGSILRYLITWVPIGKDWPLPVGTLVTNVVGSFAIGWVAATWARQASLSPELRLFLRVGLCGGFTTFSTFAFESQTLLAAGEWPWALCYIFGSVASCIVGALAGESLAGGMPA